MDGRAVIKLFIDELLETLDHLWREIGIKLNHDAAIIGCFNYRNLRIGGRFDSSLDVCAGSFSARRVV